MSLENFQPYNQSGENTKNKAMQACQVFTSEKRNTFESSIDITRDVVERRILCLSFIAENLLHVVCCVWEMLEYYNAVCVRRAKTKVFVRSKSQ